MKKNITILVLALIAGGSAVASDVPTKETPVQTSRFAGLKTRAVNTANCAQTAVKKTAHSVIKTLKTHPRKTAAISALAAVVLLYGVYTAVKNKNEKTEEITF